jgi:PAS domain S-box-containing protein
VSAALPGASILIVDDYPANLLALEAVLRPLGHAVVRAGSGEEALKAVLQHELALIIMDVQMPGMDGFQTASMIKMRDRSRHIPIIFLTAISKDAAHIFEGYAHGAVDYMLKPFDPQILRSKVSVFVDLWQRGELLKQREAKLRELEIERVQRQSAARYEALIEAMPQIVLAMHPTGELYYCNSVWQRYAGLDVAGTIASGAEIVHPDERAAVQEAWLEALLERQPLQREVRVRRARDGGYRWHLVHVLPQLDAEGALTGFIAAATDIHDEKEARQEVERASRAKDEFLATVSHELRNPLNAILGWTRMLRAGKLDPARATRALETVERNAMMQAALVEDMLDVSRIITGKLMLKVGAVDLPTVVASALDTVRMAADAKQITVAVELDAELELAAGDPERLQQVVWNLLSNAIKFTPRGGTVTVRTRRAGAHVELTVQDDGQGMPADFLPYVFDRFRQADSTSTRVHGGLGLGLAIVRHLVELHGGTVSVASEGAGKGSTFTVRLPLHEASELAAYAAAEQRSAGARGAGAPMLGDTTQLAGLAVLVVDDEPDARELLTALLEHHGATVTSSCSVDHALAAIGERAPDVVVSDIGMPGADGYELMRRLRALPDDARRATPALALTGFARPEDGARALQAGFQAHLAKPVEPVALVMMVDKLAHAASVHGPDADGEPDVRPNDQPASSPSTTCLAIG